MDLFGTMDVKLKPFNFADAAARAGMADVARRVEAKARTDASTGVQGTDRGSFQSSLTQALAEVIRLRGQAVHTIDEVLRTCSQLMARELPPNTLIGRPSAVEIR